jgi:homospermidine synthase
MKQLKQLTCIIEREGEGYVSLCPQIDIASQGDSVEEARKLAPGQNATTIQVALGIIAAAMWSIENPKKGFCLPDDLPHDYVLKVAKPYLGKFVSKGYDWTPLKNRKTYFKENPANKLDHKDPWQFKNFTFVA